MDKSAIEKMKDRRLPVLLVLGVVMVAAGYYTPVPESQSSDYYYSGNSESQSVVRIAKDSKPVSPNGEYAKIFRDILCGEITPELTMFFDFPMPINRADSDSLTLLPGIGPGLAEKIITFRGKQGNITGSKNLRQVNGIGAKLTAQLSPLVCYE